MLKLKKISRTQEIHVTLWQRESFFHKPLIYAFGIAFALHLLAILIFQVSPFKIWYSEEILPPIVVEAAMDEQNHITTEIEPDPKISLAFLTPKLSRPSLPELSSSFEKNIEVIIERKAQRNPFFLVERDRQAEYFNFEKELAYTPVQIHIAGILAEKAQKNAIEQHPQFQSLFATYKNEHPIQKYRAIYTVRVDDRTGIIFWFEPQEKFYLKKHQELAEKILREMQFQLSPAGFVTPGEIEFIFADQVEDDKV